MSVFHSYVFLSVTLPSAPACGPGVWIFNSSLLSDDIFTAKVRAFWSSWQAEKSSFPSLAVWWDVGKSRLKRLMCQYSGKQASSCHAHIRSLERTLLHSSKLNWHPISLLCTDYKVLAKVLTNRLKLVLSSVISPSQTCGVPGRFSGERVHLLQDIVNFSNSTDVGTAILSLDQEKAFGRVDWSFMLKILEHMNFGPSFHP